MEISCHGESISTPRYYFLLLENSWGNFLEPLIKCCKGCKISVSQTLFVRTSFSRDLLPNWHVEPKVYNVIMHCAAKLIRLPSDGLFFISNFKMHELSIKIFCHRSYGIHFPSSD